MHRSIVPLVAGVLTIGAAIFVGENQRRGHEADVRGIATLRRMLDSTRAALAVAPSAADSSRLGAEITEREFFIGRREFHVPLRKEGIDRWWTATGKGTIIVSVGVAFIILGVALLRRPTPRPD